MADFNEVFNTMYPRLMRDYVLGEGDARKFFAYAPDRQGLEACARAQKPSPVKKQLVSLLRRQNEEAGSPQPVQENISRFSEDNALAIVTGQQIGLFSGPLYVPLKVLKAVDTARRAEDQLERPVVPVYWLETNDHDFEEINAVTFRDSSNNLRTVSLPREHDDARSAGLLPVTDAFSDCIAEYFGSIRETEFTGELRALLEKCCRTEYTLGKAAMKLAASLFGRFGVVLFDPSDPGAVDLMRPVLEAESRMPGGIPEQTAAAVSSAGYDVTVETEAGRLNVFARTGGVRTALFRKGNSVTDREGTPVDIGSSALLPSVLSRNICQDYMFGTLAYIAGPGEISYISLLQDAYTKHGVNMPVILPRYTGTVVEPKIRSKIEALEAGPQEFILTPRDRIVHEMFTRESGLDEKEITAALLERADAFAQKVADAFPHEMSDPAFEAKIKKFSKQMHKGLTGIVGFVRSRYKQKAETAMNRAEQISDALRPQNGLQERVLNLFEFMNFYGGLDFMNTFKELISGSEGHAIWMM
jgi:bacillithiol biosynthesis cysteine-adding enzyme BshC